MFLTKWTIGRPVATLMVMLVIMVFGSVALLHLQLDMLPEMNPPVLAIITNLPGATAEEVLILITEPIEEVAATTSGIKELRSVTSEGTSLVIIQFAWQTKMSEIRAELSEKLEQIPLPEDTDKPQIIKFDPTMLPLMQICVAPENDLPLERVTSLVDTRIKPILEAVPGVASVNVFGGVNREVRIELSRDELYRYGSSISRVAGQVAAGMAKMPAGVVSDGEKQRNVRLIGQAQSISELENMVVGLAGMPGEMGVKPVRLGDLGNVSDAKIAGNSLTRLNMRPAVALQVQKEGSSNSVSVARAVRQELEYISGQFPDLQLVVALDQGQFIEDTLLSTSRSLLIGAFFALLVLMVFLGSILSTLVVAVAIPFSILATFSLLYFSGMTLNIMTLGGLALGVGMLVDNSIVVIENIYRHLQQGKSKKDAAEDGSAEVAGAITASTLTTIVVFLPVVFVGGLTGTLFKELAVTVSFALLASLVISLTVIPMLASRWLRKIDKKGRQSQKFTPLTTRLLLFSLKNKGIVLAISTLLFILAVKAIPLIGTEFLPAVDEGVFSIDLQMPVGEDFKETVQRVSELERELQKKPEIEQLMSKVGAESGWAGVQGVLMGSTESTAQIIVTLRDGERPTLDVMKEVREALSGTGEKNEILLFNLYSSLFFTPGSSANLLQLTVSGPEFDKLRGIAGEITNNLRDMTGLANVRSSADARLPEYHVLVREEEALQAGLTALAVGGEINRALRGQLVGRLLENDESLHVRVILREQDRQSIDDILQVPLESGITGQLLPLGSVAGIEEGSGPVTVFREAQRHSIEISGQLEDRDLGGMLDEVTGRISRMDLDADYDVKPVGTAMLMQEGFASLKTAFLLSLLLIYMVLAAQFESLRSPLVVIFTAPLAAIGVVAAMLLARTTFGITAYIGIIILGGIVVNNGIILVDFIEKLRRDGTPVAEATLKSISYRIRPVLMTAFTTILGLLPLAVQLGDGTELQAPLAQVLIGGMFTATFLTLIVIPVLYSIVHRQGDG